MDKTELNTRHIRPFTKHKQANKQTNKHINKKHTNKHTHKHVKLIKTLLHTKQRL